MNEILAQLERSDVSLGDPWVLRAQIAGKRENRERLTRQVLDNSRRRSPRWFGFARRRSR